MRRYRVTYLSGEVETIAANLVECDGGQYAIYRETKLVGFIPVVNVRSILKQEDDEAVND